MVAVQRLVALPPAPASPLAVSPERLASAARRQDVAVRIVHPDEARWSTAASLGRLAAAKTAQEVALALASIPALAWRQPFARNTSSHEATNTTTHSTFSRAPRVVGRVSTRSSSLLDARDLKPIDRILTLEFPVAYAPNRNQARSIPRKQFLLGFRAALRACARSRALRVANCDEFASF